MSMMVQSGRFGGGGVVGGHRYWRLFIITNGGDGSNTGLSELYLWDDVGPGGIGNGTDLTTTYGGTPSAIAANSGETADKAFDRNLTSQWACPGTANKWIAWDFGAGNERMVRAFTVRSIINFPAMSPGTMRLEYSDDNVTWTTSYTVPFINRPWSSGLNRSYATPNSLTLTAPARYWRLIGRSQTDVALAIAELELRATIGGADETGSGTATARISASGEGPARAFDNNVTTNWSSGVGYQFGEWIQYDFGSGNDKTIAEVMYTARNAGNVGESLKTGALQYSRDAVFWKDAFVINAATWTTLGSTQLFS